MEDSSSKILVTYLIEAQDLDAAASVIAKESSIGTWTDIPAASEDIRQRYSAEVVSIDKRNERIAIVKIAYPLRLFETDNLPQLMSTIAGNVQTLGIVDEVKVIDIELPEKFIKGNRGPNFGIVGLRDKIRVYDRPLISTVVKPKLGISLQNYAKFAYEAWAGGADIVRDDENLTDQDISPFYERVNVVMTALVEAEKVTGEKKIYIPNVTARLSEMYARAKFVQEIGGTAVMVDAFSVGMSGLQFMRDQNLDLMIHGHRLNGLLNHGLSLLAIAKLVRLAGVDFVQIPTHFEQSKRTGEDLVQVNEFLKSPFYKLNTVMPIASGGLHAGHIERLVEILGKDHTINISGGIMAHPMGVESGARAIRQAVEGVMSGKKLREISGTSVELKAAIDKWGVFGEESFRHENPHTNLYPLVKSRDMEIESFDEDRFSVKTVESRDDL